MEVNLTITFWDGQSRDLHVDDGTTLVTDLDIKERLAVKEDYFFIWKICFNEVISASSIELEDLKEVEVFEFMDGGLLNEVRLMGQRPMRVIGLPTCIEFGEFVINADIDNMQRKLKANREMEIYFYSHAEYYRRSGIEF